MKRVYIIAEAGVNHNGDLSFAKKLVDAAVETGADAVKFQSFQAEDLVAEDAPKAAYQMLSTEPSESQLEMLRKLELRADEQKELSEYCRNKSMTFLSTPFDTRSVDILEHLDVSAFKIASGEITNIPLIRYAAKKQRPIFLSTGMSTLDDVAEAVNAAYAEGNRNLTLLHCVTEYPAPIDQVNLRAMLTMQKVFGLPVGYSDHTLGTEVAIAAVVLGATVIEKHFTLNREMEGPDHRASLDPAELKFLVRQIRNIESALGDGLKRPAPCEFSNLSISRRSVFARVDIPAGSTLREGMIVCKRPGNGISPRHSDELIGKRVKRTFQAGTMLDWEGIEGTP